LKSAIKKTGDALCATPAFTHLTFTSKTTQVSQQDVVVQVQRPAVTRTVRADLGVRNSPER
jgi:predicted unusual protein kinase regulating ubiquinone biosynthesis (AarF/ABC1/UbiB family)